MEAAALHDDALAAVLGRLPARSLAASRCICKAWRAVVDERRLLLQRLLPQAVLGFFVNYQDHSTPHFFARPAAAPTDGGRRILIDGRFGFIKDEIIWYYRWSLVVDHCEGLVLYWANDAGPFYVCNPVTRWSKRLPRCTGGYDGWWKRHAFLVFDPAVSKHYRVLLVPRELKEKKHRPDDSAWRSMEWPPSRWRCRDLSSRTGRWRERVFVREGEAAEAIADLLMDSLPYSMEPRWRFAAYWKGALYVHCHGEYVARMSLSDATYRVIKSPIDRTECYNNVKSFLGKSQKGVYFAAVDRSQLRVWILDDALDPTEWILKHDRFVNSDDWWEFVQRGNYRQIKLNGPWILDENEKSKTRDDAEWNSDDDNVMQTVDWEEDMYTDTFHVLGFHPYKEVIFLPNVGLAVAHHLNSSKVRFLGILKPRDHNYGVTDSFVYTPCLRPA
ncbi:hypothetical protein EJB05_57140, partial [Eragrostis curvula]